MPLRPRILETQPTHSSLSRGPVPHSFLAYPFSKITLGNDYPYLLGDRKEIAFGLRSGTFPMFIPLYPGGTSFSAKPLGALFHPSTPLLAFLPWYWESSGELVITFFRLATIGFCHFVLFEMFSALGFSPWFALLLGALPVYNERMLDSFRYGASLENYTGFLLLAATFVFLLIAKIKRQNQWPAFVAGVLSGYWLITGGHPQWMFFELIVLFVLAWILPYWVRLFIPYASETQIPRRFWMQASGLFLAILCVSSPFLLSFYFDFFTENVGRAHQAYGWTVDFQHPIADFLMNFIVPWLAEVHTGFGGSPLFLLAALSPLTVLLGQKIPGVIWAIYGICLGLAAYCLGSATPLHSWLYHHAPFFSSFRVPGRMSVGLPLLLTMILAWLLQYAQPRTLRRLIIAALFLAFWHFTATPRTGLGYFIPQRLNSLPDSWILFQFLAGIFLLASFWYVTYRKALLCAFVILALSYSSSVLRFGSWLYERKGDTTYAQIERAKRLESVNRSPDDPKMASKIMSLYRTKEKEAPPLIYVGHDLQKVASQEEAIHRFSLEPFYSGKIFVEGNEAPPAKLQNLRAGEIDSVELLEISSNYLRFDVHTARPGLLVLGMPDLGSHWEALHDGKSYAVQSVNGGFPAVVVEPGQTVWEFRYFSKAMAFGVILSLTTIWLIFVVWSYSRSRRHFAYKIGGLAVALLFLGLAWRHSLYSGRPWGLEHKWTSSHSASIVLK